MKTIYMICAAVLVSACAGNPPAWWNPAGKYDNMSAGKQTAQPATKKVIVIQEEALEPLPDNSYEEITLTPMPDEDNEDASGLAASQNEDLAPDDLLPLPSVLD